MKKLKQGMDVVIRGMVEYFQDHAVWRNDFGEHGKVFKIHQSASNAGYWWCEADGYGILSKNGGKYGNGKIAIHEKYLHRLPNNGAGRLR